MREVERIVEQLNHSVEGGAWHGPALLEVLDRVTAFQAAARPLSTAHSIWEIVAHCTVWMNQIRLRLQGNAERDLPPERDWPPHPAKTDDLSWQETVSRLAGANRALAADITALNDSRLDDPIVEGFSSVYVTLHGVVQHNLYHAGQIALLRKQV